MNKIILLAFLSAGILFAADDSTPSQRRISGGGGAVFRGHFFSSAGLNQVFADNGLTAPTASFGAGGMGFLILPGRYLIGGGAFSYSASNTSGSSFGEVDLKYSGLYFGKDFLDEAPVDVILGIFIAPGSTKTSLFTPSGSGQIIEKFYLLEPMLSISYPVFRFLRLAVNATYLFPIVGSLEGWGKYETPPVRIASSGWSLGIFFVFGASD